MKLMREFVIAIDVIFAITILFHTTILILRFVHNPHLPLDIKNCKCKF
jgi:hypothetical protein